MSPDSKSSGGGWLRKNIYQPLHPITKGSPGKCHPPAEVAEIDQEAYWHQATQKAEWEKCSLSHKPSVTHTPSGTPRGLRNPFCPHGISSREWGTRKMLHLAIINYLEANEKNIKSQQRNWSMEKNQMELPNWKRQKNETKPYWMVSIQEWRRQRKESINFRTYN